MYKSLEELNDYELEYFGQMTIYGEYHSTNVYLWQCYPQLIYFIKKFGINIITIRESKSIKQYYKIYCKNYVCYGDDLEKTIIRSIIGHKFGPMVNVDD